jgi:hypothetical protein
MAILVEVTVPYENLFLFVVEGTISIAPLTLSLNTHK